MKLSDLDEKDIEVVEQPKAKGSLKLSDLDPSHIETVTSEAPKADEVSYLESLLRGAAQGGTMGFADEISGGVEAAAQKLMGEEGDLGDLYRKYREQSRENFKAAETANPRMSTAGNIVGGLATVVAPGAIAGKGAAAALTRLLTDPKLTVKAGAALGGVTGLGTSEADITQGELSEAAYDTAKGTAMGAAGGKIIPTLGPKLAASIGAGVGYAGGDENSSAGDTALNTLLGAGMGLAIGKGNEKSGTSVNYLKKLDDALEHFDITANAKNLLKEGIKGKSYVTKEAEQAIDQNVVKVAEDLADTLVGTAKDASDIQGLILDKNVKDDVKVALKSVLQERRDSIAKSTPIGTEQEKIKEQALKKLDDMLLGFEKEQVKFVPKAKPPKPSAEDKAVKALEQKRAELQAKNAALGNNKEVSPIEKVYDPENDAEVLRMIETGPGKDKKVPKIVRDEAAELKNLENLSDEEKAVLALQKIMAQERAKAEQLGMSTKLDDITNATDENGLGVVSTRSRTKVGDEIQEKPFAKAYEQESPEFTPIKTVKETVPGEEEVVAAHAKAIKSEEPVFTPLERIITKIREGGKESLTPREAKDAELLFRGMAEKAGNSELGSQVGGLTKDIHSTLASSLPESERLAYEASKATQAKAKTAQEVLSPNLGSNLPADKIKAKEDLIKLIRTLSGESNAAKAKQETVNTALGGLKSVRPDIVEPLEGKIAESVKEQKLLKAATGREDIAGTYGAVRTLLGKTLNPGANILGLGIHKGKEAVTHFVKNATPESVTQVVSQLRAQHGPKAEKLATVLGGFAEKDQRGRNALMFSIMQNPEYRDMLGLNEER